MPKVGVSPCPILLNEFVGMSLSLVFVFFTTGATRATKVSTCKFHSTIPCRGSQGGYFLLYIYTYVMNFTIKLTILFPLYV